MTILCYHAIDTAWSSPLAVRPDAFAAHCAWLAAHRRLVDLEEAVERMGASGRLPRRTVAVTFDDGFASLYDEALRVLRDHDVPATVFLVSGTLSSEPQSVDWVDTPVPDTLRTLTADQIAAMRSQGIRFGSHSHTHRDLTSLTDQECLADLTTSRGILEDLLEEPVRMLAYPRGLHDERVRRLAARAGFTHAFALPERREQAGPYSIPRVGIYRGNRVRTVQVKVSPWYLSVRTGRLAPVLGSIRGPGRNGRADHRGDGPGAGRFGARHTARFG